MSDLREKIAEIAYSRTIAIRKHDWIDNRVLIDFLDKDSAQRFYEVVALSMAEAQSAGRE